jgi:hypothetical protein
MSRNLFELLLAHDGQAVRDAAYFTSSLASDGRRFSREFHLRHCSSRLLIFF